MRLSLVSCLLSVALWGCPDDPGPAAAPARAEPQRPGPSRSAQPRWLKGQLHLHSSFSADSETRPEAVIRWYREHGYDFIVFTDHDHITEPETVSAQGMLVFPGVELTQNLRSCDPPPLPGMACLLHVNALLVEPGRSGPPPWSEPTGDGRLARYRRALAAARELGGVTQLNHPNFHYSADAELITRLAREGLTLLEVANEAVDSNNGGDAEHPTTEELWDAVLSQGVRVWGTATDDAHHYDDADDVRRRGEVAHTGDRGFVMVRAEPERDAILEALRNGDFYASSGVTLSEVGVEAGVLRVVVASTGSHELRFIGRGGRTLSRMDGRRGEFPLSRLDAGGYVRCVITDARGRRAWTQPAMATP